MTLAQALAVFRHWDKRGHHVFTRRALAKLFPNDSAKTFTAGLNRLVRSGLLVRAARGVYVNPHAASLDSRVVERVAAALRPGEYNYVSLESMLSEYGHISQIPIDRLTVMTTGRKGTYRTPYGVIEFTHTRRPVRQIIEGIRSVDGRPLRIATAPVAWRDHKRLVRKTAMVDETGLAQ